MNQVSQVSTRLIQLPEVTHLTSLHKTKIYQLINSGELRPIKLGRKTVFSEQEVNQWIENKIANRAVA